MSIIGNFKATDEGYSGSIETLTLKAGIRFETTPKTSDNQPDYRVFHITEHNASEIGAAWTKTPREGSQYLSVSIDDPVFAERISCRLVKSGAGQGHTLYWDRQRPRD